MALLLAIGVVSAFLSHFSLLDGAPRNSFQMFLDAQAHRPFVYRILAPTLVRCLDASLPNEIRVTLADRIAPVFRAKYVEPLTAQYEPLLPGITARAHADWERAEYRSSYVLMVLLMLGSFVGAILLVHRAARLLGSSSLGAYGAMLLYATITPTMFLNGGYFYDFTEQLGALLLICCVLEERWFIATITLIVMQFNKETALLMVLFLAPYVWHLKRSRTSICLWVIPQLTLCCAILFWVRWKFANLPGLPSEWHFLGNIAFWADLSSWTKTADFYSVNFELPRMTYLYFALVVLLRGWMKNVTPILVSATFAFLSLMGLLMMMGYHDEFRNLSLATPFLVLLFVERRASSNYSLVAQ